MCVDDGYDAGSESSAGSRGLFGRGERLGLYLSGLERTVAVEGGRRTSQHSGAAERMYASGSRRGLVALADGMGMDLVRGVMERFAKPKEGGVLGPASESDSPESE